MVLFFISLALVYGEYSEFGVETKDITVSEVITEIEEGIVESLLIQGEEVTVAYTDETLPKGKFKKEAGVALSETFENYGVTALDLRAISVEVKDGRGFLFWVSFVVPILFPILILGFLIWLLIGQVRSAGSQAFSFGRSRARMIDPKDKATRITFDDVAGIEEVKQELFEFVDFLKNPQKYISVGARVPKGLILTGPPGTGKTLLARAVAGEAKVPFYSISGSEFVEMFVGVGASRVRDLFRVAKKSAPSIIFIDEIDAVGRARGVGVGGGNDEREQTLNQILVEMDGFEPNDKLIVIAATNRSDVLDAALLRPGRFDRKVFIPLPTLDEREKILKVHSKGKPLAKNVEFLSIARRTVQFSGADLNSVVNEAAIFAARMNKKEISQNDFLTAIEKVILGPEKKSQTIEEEDRKVVAYHESGHALLSSILPYADPVQKISIVGRGHAGGYVLSTPDRDILFRTKEKFIQDIMVALGGYICEKKFFKDVSTGPSSDLEKVTAIARNMVTRWGMSEKIGPLVVDEPAGRMPQGSGAIRELVDKEVSLIVKTSLKKAQILINKNEKVIHALANKLLEVETMERGDYEKFLLGHSIILKNLRPFGKD